VHGSRAGFAAQFGDKDGDGYASEIETERTSEASPAFFTAGSFGVSSFSPGTPSSQIFVVVSDAPQLTGERVYLGRAEGPWQLLTTDDVLYSIKLL
jgi:cyclophilin family peptidyl-prolyl cis-trans isomerase